MNLGINIQNATAEQRSNLTYHMWTRRWLRTQVEKQNTFTWYHRHEKDCDCDWCTDPFSPTR